MARTEVVIAAPPETVFSVLSDAPAYGRFVVGSKKIRDHDERWPEIGSELHHTVGVGPLVLRDATEVVDIDPPRRLVLLAGMRPLGCNKVDFQLSSEGTGTRLVVEEHPVDGPMARVWCTPFDWLMWLRNREMLRRLGVLARKERAPAGP